MTQPKQDGRKTFSRWLLSKIDKKGKLSQWKARMVRFINERPILKTMAKIALIAYTVVTLVSQLISFPAFSAGLARKNSVLKEDYAAAEACFARNKVLEPCTVSEITSLKKAWDNDILMCYGHGTACVADKMLDIPDAPLPKPPAHGKQ